MKHVPTFCGAVILAAMLATPLVPVHAQAVSVFPESAEDHDAHHPDGDETTTSSPTPVPASPSQPRDMTGMVPMMRGGDMMGMVPMMRGGETMERRPTTRGGEMMERRSTTRGRRMMGGMAFEHVEGRLAFLKTELKITPAQEPQWTKFAAAIRSVAQSTKAMYEQAMQDRQTMQDRPMMRDRRTMEDTESAVARLERYERMLGTRLAAVRTVKDAFDPLYAALSGEQKKVADKLVADPMGVF